MDGALSGAITTSTQANDMAPSPNRVTSSSARAPIPVRRASAATQ
jgi:hypothetical protein